jgi:DNA modification methylase
VTHIQTITIPNPELVATSQLKADGKNPNKMKRDQLDRLKKSIQTWGFIVPIITNKDLLIADGEQRWIVANELAMPNVLVIRLPVEEVDRRLLRQVLNKLRGEHELLLDAEEFDKIIELGRKDDLKYLLDLTDGKLERYLNELHPPKDEDYEVPEIEKVQTDIVKGDIIQLGKHRLMCGDSSDLKDCMVLIEKKITLVLSSPPYFNQREYSHWEKYEDYLTFITKVFQTFKQFQDDKFLIAWNVGDSVPDKQDIPAHHSAILSKLGYVYNDKIAWVKSGAVFSIPRSQHIEKGIYYPALAWEPILIFTNGHHPSFDVENKDKVKTFIRNVWEINQVRGQEQDKMGHPAMFPLELASNAVFAYTQPEQYVYDCFGGSGSTLITCEQNKRICYTMEIDNRYCQVIINRWEAYSGLKAVKIRQVESTLEQNNKNNN